MNLSVIKKIESGLINLFFAAVFLALAFFCVKRTYDHYVMLDNNEYVMATVESVTHGRKSNYYIEISYEKDSEIHTGNFYAHKKLTDSFGNYFNKKYAVGQKIPVIIDNGPDVIPYGERKSTLISDIITSVMLIAFVMLFLWLMITNGKDEEEFDIKECLCSIFNIMAYGCFISSTVIFLFLMKYVNFSLFLLLCGFVLITLPEIIIKREIHIKSHKVTFQESPGVFIFACAVDLYVIFLLVKVLLISK